MYMYIHIHRNTNEHNIPCILFPSLLPLFFLFQLPFYTTQYFNDTFRQFLLVHRLLEFAYDAPPTPRMQLLDNCSCGVCSRTKLCLRPVPLRWACKKNEISCSTPPPLISVTTIQSHLVCPHCSSSTSPASASALEGSVSKD